MNAALDADLSVLGDAGFKYLEEHYDVEDAVDGVLRHLG